MHVIRDEANGRWVVKKSGASVPGVFTTRKEAIAEAIRLIKGKSSQVVVLTNTGKIVSAESHGLPKVRRVAVRRQDRSKAIENAVSAVVKARLTPA
jgi:hypothetical protein